MTLGLSRIVLWARAAASSSILATRFCSVSISRAIPRAIFVNLELLSLEGAGGWTVVFARGRGVGGSNLPGEGETGRRGRFLGARGETNDWTLRGRLGEKATL